MVKNFKGQNIFYDIKALILKFFCKKIFVVRKILEPKKTRVLKNFGSNKIGRKKFWVKKNFGKKIFGQKEFSGQNFFVKTYI